MGNVADAMRLGAQMNPQAFGPSEYGVSTCGIGAAYEGARLMLGFNVYEGVTNLFIKMRKLPCPDLRCSQDHHSIPHLNDDHLWTREQIADHVEILEKELE